MQGETLTIHQWSRRFYLLGQCTTVGSPYVFDPNIGHHIGSSDNAN